MMGYPVKFFMEEWPRWGVGGKVNRYFTYFKGNFSQMVYITREFDAQAEFLANKMINNPRWAVGLLQQVEKWSTGFFKEMAGVKSIPLSRLINVELALLMEKVGQKHRLSHGLGGALSWHADATGAVTKHIMNIIQHRLQRQGLNRTVPDVFSVLTTSTKPSFVIKEEKSFLQIAQSIIKKRKLKTTFIQSNFDKLVVDLKQLDSVVYRLIMRHYNKFAPLTYQYKGPAFPLDYYIGRWQALLRDGQAPAQLLKKLAVRQLLVKKDQKKLVRQLHFTRFEIDLIKMARYMTYIKDYRKNALYQGMFNYESIFKEIGKRLELSINQIQAMRPWEVIAAIKSGKANSNELNQRQILTVDYWYKKSGKWHNRVLTGKRAKQFLKKITWQKVQSSASELFGTCAYPGKVQGVVKIINIPEEMSKMKSGNIMVSHNTNPNLVPAMKKARALVSVAGGLTCHTAIVAREMQVPCVVGVIDCDKVLKDGDRVEVDATKGMVKKL